MNIKIVSLCMMIVLLAGAGAGAQGGADEPGSMNKLFVGRWTGAGGNSLYAAEALIIIRAVSPETNELSLSGPITVRPSSGGAPTIMRLRGRQVGDTGEGNVTYTDATGASKFTTFESRLIEGGYSVEFNSGEFGSFAIPLRRTLDISGVWLFPDGNPMTITRQDDGSLMGAYKGTAASGHTGLSGTLSGTLETSGNVAVWDGFITITEADVLATGRFRMEYKHPAQVESLVEETLEGTITASSNIDPIVRTNPIKLIRGEG